MEVLHDVLVARLFFWLLCKLTIDNLHEVGVSEFNRIVKLKFLYLDPSILRFINVLPVAVNAEVLEFGFLVHKILTLSSLLNLRVVLNWLVFLVTSAQAKLPYLDTHSVLAPVLQLSRVLKSDAHVL